MIKTSMALGLLTTLLFFNIYVGWNTYKKIPVDHQENPYSVIGAALSVPKWVFLVNFVMMIGIIIVWGY